METELSTLLPPDMFQDVSDFHRRVLQQPQAETPSLISRELIVERWRFLQEELDEFIDAGFKGDMVGAADGLADIIYVALGTMYIMNLPADSIWRAVHEANMRKVSGPTKRGNKYDAMKPPGWVGPENAIAEAIGEAIK